MIKKFTLIFAVILAFSAFSAALADEEPATSTLDIAPVPVPPRELISEPNIRVNLAKFDKPVVFMSSSTYYLYSGGNLRLQVDPGQQVSVYFKNNQYQIASGGLNFALPDAPRFISNEPNAVFALSNFERKISGHKANYNIYRGVFEYRYSAKNKIAYLVNELPLEQYLADVTETAPGDPLEYVKTVIIAARTYAYNLLGQVSDKHLFDVYGSTIDQLYLGYNAELRLPEVKQAAEETKGQMITYEGKPINAVYFSRSNGKTKTWKNKTSLRPYLVSVVAKYDKGKRLLGHGYGMSLHDAGEHIDKDGWDYLQTLKYYYTGVEVEQIY